VATVPERNPYLLFKEIYIINFLSNLLAHRVFKKQPLYSLPPKNVFFNDFFDIFNPDFTVHGTLWQNNHNRAAGTESKTSGMDNPDLFQQASLFKLFFEFGLNLAAFTGYACCTPADKNM
jgi:hypothetical protein